MGVCSPKYFGNVNITVERNRLMIEYSCLETASTVNRLSNLKADMYLKADPPMDPEINRTFR